VAINKQGGPPTASNRTSPRCSKEIKDITCGQQLAFGPFSNQFKQQRREYSLHAGRDAACSTRHATMPSFQQKKRS
jgi:hypothetical protein